LEGLDEIRSEGGRREAVSEAEEMHRVAVVFIDLLGGTRCSSLGVESAIIFLMVPLFINEAQFADRR
jgi:hypothetical protein